MGLPNYLYTSISIDCGSETQLLFPLLPVQDERENEEKRLAEIMVENNRKILDAQRKLVRESHLGGTGSAPPFPLPGGLVKRLTRGALPPSPYLVASSSG